MITLSRHFHNDFFSSFLLIVDIFILLWRTAFVMYYETSAVIHIKAMDCEWTQSKHKKGKKIRILDFGSWN